MILAFRKAMEEHGLIPPQTLFCDGKIHRCKVQGHRSISGAYRISPDGGYGGFQNWTSGLPWQPWSIAKTSELTTEQGEAIREASRRAAERTRLERESAKRRAVGMWEAAKEGPHPYLDKKGICSNGSRVLGDFLLIPLMDWEGALTSIQTITPAGEKKFLRGGQFHGSFHWIRCGSNVGRRIYVCEGFATGSTIHAATGGKPVCVAFACGNLLPIARVLREHLRTQHLVFCADDDRNTPGNPGITKANAAAAVVGGSVVVPHGMAGTDFNDLQCERGISWVSEQLKFPKKPML